MGIFDFFRKEKTSNTQSTGHVKSQAALMTDHELIVHTLQNENDQVSALSAINHYTDLKLLEKINKECTGKLAEGALKRSRVLTLEHLVKSNVNDADQAFFDILTDKELLKIVRQGHCAELKMIAFSKLKEAESLKSAACAEDKQVARAAVESLEDEKYLNFVVKNAKSGNVKNLAKRKLREMNPEQKQAEVKAESGDQDKQRKIKSILSSLHAMSSLSHWDQLGPEYEKACAAWADLAVEDDSYKEQFKTWSDACAEKFNAYKAAESAKIEAREKAEQALVRREALAAKLEETLDEEALVQVESEFNELDALDDEELQKNWHRELSQKIKRQRKDLEALARREENRQKDQARALELLADLEAMRDEKKPNFGKLRRLQKDWTQVAANATEEQVKVFDEQFKVLDSLLEEVKSEQQAQSQRAEELCKKVEQVESVSNANSDMIKASQKELNEICSGLKQGGDLRSRFRKAADAYFNKVAESHEDDAFKEMANEQQAEELFEQMKELAVVPADSKLFNKIKAFRQTWNGLRPLPKSRYEKIKQSFEDLAQALFVRWTEFTKEQDAKRDANLVIKRELIEKAREVVKDWTDSKETGKAVHELQKEWKESGPVKREISEEVWEEFNGICQSYYAEADEIMKKSETAKRQLLERVNQLLADTEKHKDFHKDIIDLRAKWKEAGFAGYKSEKELWPAFNEACNTIFAASQAEKNKFRAERNEVRQEREALIASAKQLVTQLKEQGLNRSAESVLHYLKVLLNDLGKCDRRTAQEQYDVLSAEIAEFKELKYEEPADFFLLKLKALEQGENDFTPELQALFKALVPAARRAHRVNKVCQDMEKLSRQPIQYDDAVEVDLKKAAKDLMLAMTSAPVEEEERLPSVNSRQAQGLAWSYNFRIFVELMADENEAQVKQTLERYLKAAKAFSEATSLVNS